MDLGHDGGGQEIQQLSRARRRCWTQSLSLVFHTLYLGASVCCARDPLRKDQTCPCPLWSFLPSCQTRVPAVSGGFWIAPQRDHSLRFTSDHSSQPGVGGGLVHSLELGGAGLQVGADPRVGMEMSVPAHQTVIRGASSATAFAVRFLISARTSQFSEITGK